MCGPHENSFSPRSISFFFSFFGDFYLTLGSVGTGAWTRTKAWQLSMAQWAGAQPPSLIPHPLNPTPAPPLFILWNWIESDWRHSLVQIYPSCLCSRVPWKNNKGHCCRGFVAATQEAKPIARTKADTKITPRFHFILSNSWQVFLKRKVMPLQKQDKQVSRFMERETPPPSYSVIPMSVLCLVVPVGAAAMEVSWALETGPAALSGASVTPSYVWIPIRKHWGPEQSDI